MTLTTNQLAERLRIDREDTYTLIRFLEAQGVIRRAGALEPETKRRGKRQYTYEINNYTLDAIRALLDTKPPKTK